MNEYWEKYKRCMDYMHKKNLIAKSDKAWNFYLGNQWEGIQSGGEELPFFNFIKPVIKHKIATVSQNKMVANYSDLEGRREMDPIYEKLNQKFSACWEKANMDVELWNVTKQAAIVGDAYQFYGTANAEDVQVLPNTCVLLGDEQNADIQAQPYIIIRERLFADDVRKIAEQNGVEDIDAIVPDSESNMFVGNKDELQTGQQGGKCTAIIYMEKIDGIVHVAKAVESCVYAPLKPVQAENPDGSKGKGLSLYPIVNMVWEDKPNDARGKSEVEALIPNQIEVNKTLARRSISVKLSAFPRLAYDSNAIRNPDDLDKVGAKIEVGGGGMQSVNQLITYLSPMSMSPDAKSLSDDILSISQELSGAGETSMGNIDPNRVAASAIIAIRDQAALPLNEQVAKSESFVEELAKLWIEIWMTYNPNGFEVLMTDDEGNKYPEQITKEELDKLKPDIRIDTSKDTPWTRESEQQALDKLLDKQLITFEDYVDLVPSNSVIPKNKLKNLLDKRKQEMERMQAQQAAEQADAVNTAKNNLLQEGYSPEEVEAAYGEMQGMQ